MKIIRNIFAPVLIAAAVLSGCDGLEVLPVDEYVVESYLISGVQLPIVRLSRTIELTEEYNFADAAVLCASTRIDLLAADGSIETTYSYSERQNLYWPNDIHLVLPGRTYQLHVDLPGETIPLTASTIVPGDFEIVAAAPDSVLYQDDVQFEVNVTESVYPGRQAVYVFSVESLEPTAANLTPFYREVIGDDLEDLNDVVINESFVINEANFEEHPDGTFSIKLPWLAVAFYGPNDIVVSTLDDNMFDFIRSHQVQQGGSTFSPGEIPNIIDRIEGGTGVFASMTRQSAEVFIKDREF